MRNASSRYDSISCGVTQESLLGPLLFLHYINDFSCSSKLFDFHLCADDSNLFFADKSIDNLQEIHTSLCANKLSLNIDKSNFVIFYIAQKRSNNTISLEINDKVIKQQNFANYLGLMLDRNLNWTEQVRHLCKQVSRSIGITSKLRHFATNTILVQLYYSLIYPFLGCRVLVWGNTYKTTLKRLSTFYKRKLLEY